MSASSEDGSGDDEQRANARLLASSIPVALEEGNSSHSSDNESGETSSSAAVPLETETVSAASATDDAPSAAVATKATPLPRIQILVLGLITLGNSFNMSLIYPIVPFAVAFFEPQLSASELGYRAGWLAAAFSAGQFVSSIPMNRLSDRWGRKPLLIFGLIGTTVAIAWFGLAQTFWVAFFARLAWGLLNANIGITKVAIAEICDDSNSALGLSILGVSDGIGRLTGPFLGGYLIFPAKKWPTVFASDGFFGDFPFILPCAFGLFVCVIALVSTIFFKESLRRDPLAVSDALAQAHADEGVPTMLAHQGRFKPRLVRRRSLKERSMLWRLMRSRTTVVPVLLYMMLGTCASTLQEVWPLWALLPLAEGGFNMGSSEVGLLLVVGSPVQMIGQLVVFPRITKRFGFLRTFQCSILFVGVCAFITPFCNVAASSTFATWIVVGVLWSSVSSVWMFSFTSIFALINNGCRRRERGAANGIGQTLVSVGRSVGPLFGGIIFAWSASSDNAFPFDYHFTFFLLGILFALTAALSLVLPKTIDKRLVELDEETSDHVELMPANSKRLDKEAPALH
jgi:MFS family permease